MKLRINKKLFLLATTSTLALNGCGLDSKYIGAEPIDLEYVVEDPTINYSNDVAESYSSVLENTLENNQVEEISPIVYDGEYVIANTTVNIRENADANSKELGLLGINTSAKLLGEEDGFYKIEYLDIIGYVSKEYANPYKREHVNMEPIDAVYFTKEALIYDEGMEAKATVPQYEFALVYEDNNDTYLVDADGLVGYVDKNVVQHVAEDENYVVVDISDQNVKIYNGVDVLLDTPVVTGRPSSPTKVGYFTVWSDWGMRRLACFGRPWVNVMKKFDQGRGLHDAEIYTEENGFKHGWRDSSEFGGNTYLTNGSHGCVNMPHDAAMETDELVKEGTKVLVKR